MTGMIRIRAKAVQPPPRDPSFPIYPMLNGILPSWADVEVFVVAEDGSETPLAGVRSIAFKAEEGSEPLKATLEVYVDEVDVVAERVES